MVFGRGLGHRDQATGHRSRIIFQVFMTGTGVVFESADPDSLKSCADFQKPRPSLLAPEAQEGIRLAQENFRTQTRNRRIKFLKLCLISLGYGRLILGVKIGRFSS